MTQAFYTSISGINANQQQLVVVADNIANMNTTAFKTSRVTFADVYYKTLSSGTAPTTTCGGCNPKQAGTGVQISSIARDFTTGNITSTGINTDCNIQGNGFFVVQGSGGENFYTRDGNFALDSEGYLTLSTNGYRVAGATQSFSSVCSDTAIKIPQMIDTETVANTVNLETKDILKLNGLTTTQKGETLTTGNFSITATVSNGTYGDNLVTTTQTYQVEIDENDDTLEKIAKKISSALKDYEAYTFTDKDGKESIVYGGYTDESGNPIYKDSKGNIVDTSTGSLTKLNGVQLVADDFEISFSEGKMKVDVKDHQAYNYNDGGTPATEKVVYGGYTDESGNAIYRDNEGTVVNVTDPATQLTEREGDSKLSNFKFVEGTSNFVYATNLNQDTGTAGHNESKVLDYKQNVTVPPSTDVGAKYSSIEIGSSGIIEITYNNGDKLSVYTDDNNQNQFKYVTNNGITIYGDATDTSDVYIDKNLLSSANLQLQLAQFMNPNGLTAAGGNLYSIAPNAGTAYYGVGGENAFGTIQTGGLESSNVDLSTEFANMITAQRAVEANSRIFNTANDLMETLVYLGN